MTNRVCDMLGIEFPILAFSHCRDVIAAVTNAGGFGVLGAVAHTPEQLEIDLAWIEEHVKGRPYGVDPRGERSRGASAVAHRARPRSRRCRARASSSADAAPVTSPTRLRASASRVSSATRAGVRAASCSA